MGLPPIGAYGWRLEYLSGCVPLCLFTFQFAGSLVEAVVAQLHNGIHKGNNDQECRVFNQARVLMVFKEEVAFEEGRRE